MNGFQTPSVNEDFDHDPFIGSMQQILAANVGQNVICEFLVGTNTTASKSGILYSVGVKYLALHNRATNTYTVCDIFAIKFVTFLNDNMPNLMYQR